MGERVNAGAHEGIKVGGTGMDMGFSLVYNLSWTLYRDGFDCIEYQPGERFTPEYGEPYTAIGEPRQADTPREDRCPANDHVNYRRGGPPVPYHHDDGGYALNHAWL